MSDPVGFPCIESAIRDCGGSSISCVSALENCMERKKEKIVRAYSCFNLEACLSEVNCIGR